MPPAAPVIQTASRQAVPAERPAPKPGSQPGAPAFSWSQVASADYFAYVDHLRAIHCPAETRDRIIRRVVVDDWTTKERSIWEPLQPHFWDAAASEHSPRKDEFEQGKTEAKGLREERDALLKGLLEASPSRKHASHYQSLLGNSISRETVAKIEDVRSRFDSQIAAIDTADLPSSEKDARKSALVKQRDSETAAALTPAETAEFKAREARQRAPEIYGFAISQEELRTLVQYEAQAPREPATNGARIAADASIKAYLGDDRFAQYQRSKTQEFADLWRLSVRYELPLQAAAEVYVLQKQAQAAAAQIRATANLSPELRDSSLDEIQSQTRQSIAAALGPAAASTYARSTGAWIEKLFDEK